jgi:hypothetical protein
MIDHDKINYAGLIEGDLYQVHYFRLRAGGNALANIQVLDFGENEGYAHETYIIDERLVKQAGKAVVAGGGFKTIEEAINDSIAQLITIIAESNVLHKIYVGK